MQLQLYLVQHIFLLLGLVILQKITTYIIQDLYALGARKIGVTMLPPIGCIPIIITLYGSGNNKCVEEINDVALNFNKKLNFTTENLVKMLSGLNLVFFDLYQPLYELVTKPSNYGFFEARKGCCASGLVEVGFTCNRKSIGTCANASEYVFWDSLHPTQATNKFLIDRLIPAIISLVYN
ncbi:putative SGNH hydrolase-type esterase domain-containing protein [Medicago truncatula]|uniref:Putative SGNH hydrolase-type esterase domain-containing protein n=1 Tax=Medicago truncatula TaxID=3880 RepID=A0A396I4Z5_MEDTR|nr:putative SGNH hydrolase-type esterase domain-containing protein [Medicago truncatula]